ncbi:MAG TPA: hypothetical protein VIK29_05235 [Paludibacter sp.]
MENRTIVIIAAVDIIGILASNTLKGNIYLFDNNRLIGSSGEGTENLKTKITFKPNENVVLVWNIMPLEPESFAGISQITADEKYIKIARLKYPSSDIVYWKGTTIKPFDHLKYKLSITVGTSGTEYSCDLDIIGELAKDHAILIN